MIRDSFVSHLLPVPCQDYKVRSSSGSLGLLYFSRARPGALAFWPSCECKSISIIQIQVQVQAQARARVRARAKAQAQTISLAAARHQLGRRQVAAASSAARYFGLRPPASHFYLGLNRFALSSALCDPMELASGCQSRPLARPGPASGRPMGIQIGWRNRDRLSGQ